MSSKQRNLDEKFIQITAVSINCLRQIFKMQIKKTFVSLLPNTFSHSSFFVNPPFHTTTTPLPLLSKSTRVFNSVSCCHLLSNTSLPSQPLYTSLVGFIPVFFSTLSPACLPACPGVPYSVFLTCLCWPLTLATSPAPHPICWSCLDRLTLLRASCTFGSFCTASFDSTISALKPFNGLHLGSLLMTQVNVIVAAAAVVEMAR